MSLELALRVASAVVDVVRKNAGRPDAGTTAYIGADGEATYLLDDIAEKAAFHVLEGESAAVLSEEAGLVFFDDKPEFLFVLDPLDGSTNAVSGIPFYCTSVAVAPWSEEATLRDVQAGVVVNLVSGDIFEAELGGGAKLNREVIKTSKQSQPNKSIASLYLKSDFEVISRFSKVRAMGAVALELAHVASGGLDTLYDNRGRLKVTDVAAGKLLIEEAGGVVTDALGKDLNHSITRLEKVSVLAAANPGLHKAIIDEACKR
ncbi:inositol-1-monophosphatase [archaeon BMS3Bbin16]|nr:inositol-1-monophosphatase [archaeon BMS3Bbin16]